jgi:hypothetical protein
MNSKIKALNEKIAANRGNIAEIESELQKEWNKVFNDSTKLRDAISAVEMSNDYTFNRHGELCQFTHFYDLADFKDCREFLDNWLSDSCVYADWENDALTMGVGDWIQINDSYSRRDGRGDVYLMDMSGRHKQILSASDWIDEDTREEDEEKRNALIETWMEKEGTFPGVFRVDYHGNVFPVNTKAGA